MTTDNRTNVQIVAEELAYVPDECSCHRSTAMDLARDAVDALKEAGRPSDCAPSEERRGINLMRDLGFDEYDPKVIKARADAAFEEQIERAALAIANVMRRGIGLVEITELNFSYLADHEVHEYARVALTAAGVAPQEAEHFHAWSEVPCKPGECRMPTQPTDSEKLIAEAEIRLNTGRHVSGRQLYIADDESLIRRMSDALAASQPLDVDEEELAEMVDSLSVIRETGEDGHISISFMSGATIARAVVEYLKGGR